MAHLSNDELLEIFDRLPDLLKMAWEQKEEPGDDVYKIQDALREEHRSAGIPFKWSLPYRSFYHCSQCSPQGTEIQYELENPVMKDGAPVLFQVELHESNIHEIREHSGDFLDACKAFLEHVGNPAR